MRPVRWLRRLAASLVMACRRFPVALAVSVSLAALLVRFNHLPSDTAQPVIDAWLRAIIAVMMGLPVSLSIHLLLERMPGSSTGRCSRLLLASGLFLLAAVLLAGYALIGLPDFRKVPVIRTALIAVALFLLFLCVPYWWRRTGIALHITRLVIRLLVTILFSGILMLALFAILFTLDKLLGVRIHDQHYTDAASLVWSIFAVAYFTAGIPGIGEQPRPADSPRALRFLLHWLLIPLLWVYTIILYAYSLKIMLDGSWPHGLVASLILAYACIGLLVWFLSNPVAADSRLAAFNQRWFPWLALPLFMMLFAAIAVRAKAYGFTETRWLVLILGSWCMAATVFTGIRGCIRRRDPEAACFRMILLPVSLAFVAVATVVGPFSVFSLAVRSQSGELRVLLERNGLLSGQEIRTAPETVLVVDRSRISNILYWFDNGYHLSDIPFLPDGFSLGNAPQLLGFELDAASYDMDGHFIEYHATDRFEPIAVSGWDLIYLVPDVNAMVKDQVSGLSIQTIAEQWLVIISHQGREVYRESLRGRFATLMAGHNPAIWSAGLTLPADELTFDSQVSDMHFRLVIRRIAGWLGPGSTFHLDRPEAWILIDLP
jgi:hypothetical protein